MLISSIISFAATLTNIFLYTSFISVLFTLFLTFFVFFSYFSARFTSEYKQIVKPTIILAMLSISVIWIYNGGADSSNNLALLIIFVVALIISNKYYKYISFILFVLISGSLYLIEYYFPNIIFHFSSRAERLVENFTSDLYAAVILFFIIEFIHSNYSNERNKVLKSEKKLHDLNDELKRANDTKDQFFSIIAHDLRNPIYNLHEVSKILSKPDEINKEDYKEFIELSQIASKNVYDLLENLLVWSKNQQGLSEVNLTDIEITKIIRQNITLLSIQAKNKNIEINFYNKELIIIKSDINLFESIIRNLLTNAVKFTDNNGRIDIMIDNSDSDSIIISVKDNGIGMSENMISELETKNVKESLMGTGGEQGSGLGLVLTRNFIKMLNGELRIESEINIGTTFNFKLPK